LGSDGGHSGDLPQVPHDIVDVIPASSNSEDAVRPYERERAESTIPTTQGVKPTVDDLDEVALAVDAGCHDGDAYIDARHEQDVAPMAQYLI
jgi:hypothetical protein